MLRRLESQSRRIDEVTAQAGNWLSGTGLLIAFPGLLLAAERNDPDIRAFTLIGVAGFVYITGLFLVFISPLGRAWLDGPHWQDIAAVSDEPLLDADGMYYSIGFAIGNEALISNKRKLRLQAILLYTGLFFVIADVAMLLAIALRNLPAHRANEVVRVIIVTPTP